MEITESVCKSLGFNYEITKMYQKTHHCTDDEALKAMIPTHKLRGRGFKYQGILYANLKHCCYILNIPYYNVYYQMRINLIPAEQAIQASINRKKRIPAVQMTIDGTVYTSLTSFKQFLSASLPIVNRM